MLRKLTWKTCRCLLSLRHVKPILITRTISVTRTLHEKCHYRTLGIQRTASQDEIRKAYLEKSKMYHPDTNPDDKGAHAKFLEVKFAYESLLTKPSSSKIYTNFPKKRNRQHFKDDHINMEGFRRERPEFFRQRTASQHERRRESTSEKTTVRKAPRFGYGTIFSVMSVIIVLNLIVCFKSAAYFRRQREEKQRQYIRELKRTGDWNRSLFVKEVDGYDYEELMKGDDKKEV